MKVLPLDSEALDGERARLKDAGIALIVTDTMFDVEPASVELPLYTALTACVPAASVLVA